MIHRTGKRKGHTFNLLHPEQPLQQSSSKVNLPASATVSNGHIVDDEDPLETSSMIIETTRLSADLEEGIPNPYNTPGSLKYGKYLRDRCRYIPLRLLPHERQILHLLTAALSVSEYTSRVDIFPTHATRTRRMIVQLKQICAILSGLVVASDFRLGQEMLVEREFSDNAAWFKSVFEIGRRYKIQNPDGMRGSYGMMMYMIQVFLDELLPLSRWIANYIGFHEFGSSECVGIQFTCSIKDDTRLPDRIKSSHVTHARRRTHRDSHKGNPTGRKTQKNDSARNQRERESNRDHC